MLLGYKGFIGGSWVSIERVGFEGSIRLFGGYWFSRERVGLLGGYWVA